MFQPLRAATSAVALLLALPACAQTAPASTPIGRAKDADPALWVVKDADTTVYLFGTVHVLKPGLTWFDEAVRAAFDRSDTLVLEMVEPDPAALGKIVAAKGITSGKPTLTEQLPADKRAGVVAALAGAGLAPTTYERMKPWLAAVTATIGPLGKLGYDAASGPEKVLAAAAKQAGKPVIGLETAEQQLGFFDGLSTAAQVKFLTASVDELPKLPVEMARMVGSWSKGDPAALAAVLNDSLKESPEVARVLLTDRNKTWAGWIGERMTRPGTVFVAVGAGHLAGKEAVQAQLRARGLKAERVRY
ncbi:TraB/GumN family protein [uncultured Sphingomonas sp.]|uniref:TraB/GumN family protein n=1 Tax=uncultured Sphingomonas sp. TaxID=158754 RepID=UPI0035C9ECB3